MDKAADEENRVGDVIDGVGVNEDETKDGMERSEENEVFEEAIAMPHVHEQFNGAVDGEDDGGLTAKENGDSKVKEFDDRHPEEQEVTCSKESSDAVVEDRTFKGQEALSSEERVEVFEDPASVLYGDSEEVTPVGRNGHRSLEEHQVVSSGEKAEALGEEKIMVGGEEEELIPIQPKGGETDGMLGEQVEEVAVGGGERVPEDGQEGLNGVKSIHDGAFDKMNSDGDHAAFCEKAENMDFSEKVPDEIEQASVIRGDRENVISVGRNGNLSLQKHEVVSSGDKAEAFGAKEITIGGQGGKEVMLVIDSEEANGLVGDGAEGTVVGNGERVPEYGVPGLLGEKSVDKVNSDGEHGVLFGRAEYGDSSEKVSDESNLDHEVKYEEPVSQEDEVQQLQNVSVGLDMLPKTQAGDMRGENSSPVQVSAEEASEKTENGDSSEKASDGNNMNQEMKSEEQVSQEDGVLQMQTLSVGLDMLQNTQAVVMPDENSTMAQVSAEAEQIIEAETVATLPKADVSSRSQLTEPPKLDVGASASFGSKPRTVGGTEKETVLVDDMNESSSTDDDDNKASNQPASNVTSQSDKSGGPSLPSRPAGLGPSACRVQPASRVFQESRVNSSSPQQQSQPSEESASDDAEENRETREKLQEIRVKFLRLAHRLGQTPHNVVVSQVLYRLGLAEQLWRNTNRSGVFSFDRASVMAEQLEAAGQEPLDFSCTILVIGKTGVGKSATINSIFDEVKFSTDAFQPGTKKVQAMEGMVQGIKVKIIDTPGLSCYSADQHRNEKILHSVKKFVHKTPPDIVLYFDRLDMQSRDFGDVPLLRTITSIFGASIWFNAIVVLTHAASAPPDGSNGAPLSYEMFVTQRSHVVQQAIREASGDVRLMNPVSLVENHSACRTNRAGQRVLPNGQVWKPQLLLLSFASKILADANMVLKLQDGPPGKTFGQRTRAPPLPFLLSSLLQSRPQLKLPEEQFGDEDTIDDDLDEESGSDGESEYDELPPFKRLSKSQLSKLSSAQRKAYYEELDYREKLFFKKQLKEEKKRQKLLKKMAATIKDLPQDSNDDNMEEENSGQASVPVPMPDMVLPASFDSDNPTHRYRFLDSSQWLVRPMLESQGWDHDVGYEGLNVERLFVLKEKFPVSVSGQLTKDKKECNLQMELGTSIKHSEGKATSLGLDVQSVGKDMAYTLRGETKFNNFRRNNTAAGISATLLGDAMSAGVKIEDKLVVNKRFKLLMSGGAMTGRGDVAYGGRLEATLRDKDYPIGRSLSTLALSVVDWHGDLAIGCNVQSQLPLGRGTNIIGHANLSNRGSGQVGLRLNSSEHLQFALIALVPIFRNLQRMLFGSSQSI